jgi:hypothetical protein
MAAVLTTSILATQELAVMAYLMDIAQMVMTTTPAVCAGTATAKHHFTRVERARIAAGNSA